MLDNSGGWLEQELNTLCGETLHNRKKNLHVCALMVLLLLTYTGALCFLNSLLPLWAQLIWLGEPRIRCPLGAVVQPSAVVILCSHETRLSSRVLKGLVQIAESSCMSSLLLLSVVITFSLSIHTTDADLTSAPLAVACVPRRLGPPLPIHSKRSEETNNSITKDSRRERCEYGSGGTNFRVIEKLTTVR
jgi:hypothetical protein